MDPITIGMLIIGAVSLGVQWYQGKQATEAAQGQADKAKADAQQQNYRSAVMNTRAFNDAIEVQKRGILVDHRDHVQQERKKKYNPGHPVGTA